VSSPADGTVAEVAVAPGTNVEVGDLLVVLGG
jgi:biotin carboxyl carrier protein